MVQMIFKKLLPPFIRNAEGQRRNKADVRKEKFKNRLFSKIEDILKLKKLKCRTHSRQTKYTGERAETAKTNERISANRDGT